MVSSRPHGRRSNRFFIVLILLAAVGYASWHGAVSQMPPPWAPPDARPYQVVDVIDGDTIVVRRDRSAEPERLRYLGIDAPEMAMPPRPAQDLAVEATEANAQLVQGAGTVWVAVDERERDEHGRLLGYVFADGVFVNEELVARGLAEVMIVEPNVRYAEELLAAQGRARRAQQGLWGRVVAVDNPSSLSEYVGRMVRLRGDVTSVMDGGSARPTVIRLQAVAIGRDSIVPDGPAQERLLPPTLRDGSLSHALSNGSPAVEDAGPVIVTLIVFPEFRAYFPADFPARLRGERVEAVGRLEEARSGFQLIIREPEQIDASLSALWKSTR